MEVRAAKQRIVPWRLASLIALLTISVSTARSQQEINVSGEVADALTGRPLGGSMIIVSGWTANDGSYDQYFEAKVIANEVGFYTASLQRGYYYLIVMADDLTTPGLDYMPKLLQLDATKLYLKGIDADFTLFPGASVKVTGLADFVELGKAPDDLYFGMIDAYNSTPYFRVEDRRIYTALDLEPGIMVVPAEVPMLLCGNSPWVRFTIDDNGSYFAFRQGDLEIIDISEAVMKRNLELVRVTLNSTRLKANEFGLSGIDMKLEMDDLDTAFGYLGLATLSLHEGNYSQCFMNLRAAYIIAQDVSVTLADTLSDITFSPIPFSFLMVLSAFGLASVFVGKESLRVGSGLVISLLFLGLSYFIAPGWRLADPMQYFASSAACTSAALVLILLLPRTKKDVVTPSGIALMSSLMSTFSLATRNLKRRRLRTSLILASIFTLVFGFTVFTSFRFKAMVVYGNAAYPVANPPTGLMVVPTQALAASASIPTSLIEALRENPLVSSVAPKAETSPFYLEGQLISEGGYAITIKGAIGVSSEEVKMSHLDAAIVKGHFMAEEERRAMLISAKAAEKLRVEPGDKVEFEGKQFMVAGIMDDQILEWIVDLDGQPIRPYYIEKHYKFYIGAENMVVLNWRELVNLGLGTLTRINVKTNSAEDIAVLATELARKWRYHIYATIGEEVKLFHYRKGPMLEGSSNIPVVLVLVGLNVLACTLSAAYERRKEVVTLSLVGLNPSQISYMFLSEAVLVAFIGGVTGYMLSVGVPRLLLGLGGPGFLTEKTSWMWSVAVILIVLAVAVSASVLPARRASMMASPYIPRKWKLDYAPAEKDIRRFFVHVPQVVSKLELGRFITFIDDEFTEMQLLTAIPEKMEMRKMVDESDEEREVIKLLFTYKYAIEGERAFETENDLVMSRRKESSLYSIDLAIRIGTIYNYNPLDVVWRTASAIRRLMLRWTTTPSRWG